MQNSLNDPQVEYAIRQFHSESTLHALKTHPTARNWIISSGIDASLGSEAYQIRTAGDEIEVIGGNGAGVMYGLLHVKEQLEQGKAKIQDIEESPRFPFRAIKFNLPWSAYRKAKALEIHKETCPFPYMVRNEYFFCLRWCETDFIREHIQLNGHSYVGGYYLGSECYIPAKNFMTPPELSRGYAFERQWLYYMSWGRLLYNPETTDETFIAACKARYGEAGESLFKALKLGSSMPLQLATFFKGNWDFSLYSEGFLSHYAPWSYSSLPSVARRRQT